MEPRAICPCMLSCIQLPTIRSRYVQMAAEALYHDIENLELYVGMQAEEAKLPGPGAGLCPGYTMSRAILADAVSLTRGDRFMTTELTRTWVELCSDVVTLTVFTAQNLTSWGYEDCQFNTEAHAYGGHGMLTKLLFRTLPVFYPNDSVYAHFPFIVPSHMKAAMSKKTSSDVVNQYRWTRPDSKPRWDHKVGLAVYEERLCAIMGLIGKPVSGMVSYGRTGFTT